MTDRLKELRKHIEDSEKFKVLLSTHHWFCFRYKTYQVSLWIIDAESAVERLEYDIQMANNIGLHFYDKYL